jgi:soluble P-type ATPase
MISVDIPGWGPIRLEHIVLDYNGTLAVDGILVAGAAERLQRLSADLEVHVLTADTFGKVREGMRGIPTRVSILPPGSQDQGKLEYVKGLGVERVCAVGNGRNDRLMLAAAALGLAVILGEGASSATLAAADAVCLSVADALDLLIHPLRLTATLRS